MQLVTAERVWAPRRPGQAEGARPSRREANLTSEQVRPFGERRKTHRLLAEWARSRGPDRHPAGTGDPLSGHEELRGFSVVLAAARDRGAVAIEDVGEAFLRHMRGAAADGEAELYAAATALGVLRWHSSAVLHMHKPAFEGATVFNHNGDRIKYRCLVLPIGGSEPERCLGVASWTVERQEVWLNR